MNRRNSGEFRKVDGVTEGEKPSSPVESSSRELRRTGEFCQNGVCALSWKPSKPAAA
jgi:hypothetical protein